MQERVRAIAALAGAVIAGWLLHAWWSSSPPRWSTLVRPETDEPASPSSSSACPSESLDLASNTARRESALERSTRLRARMLELERAERWSEVYASFTLEQLVRERAAIESELLAVARPEFERRFASGEYELSSAEHAGEPLSPYDVGWIRIPAYGPAQTCRLPESFARLYKLKALSAWLEEEGEARSRRLASK